MHRKIVFLDVTILIHLLSSTATVNDPVSEFKEQTLSQGDAAIKKAYKVFTAWKKKWHKIHSDLSKEYFKIVRERHQLLLDGFKAGLASKYSGYFLFCDIMRRIQGLYAYILSWPEGNAVMNLNSVKGSKSSKWPYLWMNVIIDA